MAIQNVIGDSFAARFSIVVGVGWESNGGFGMVLDGTKASRRLASMLSGMLTTESQEGVGLVTKDHLL
jgi:urocanate hydratase